jgi:hypothetical protein
VNALVQQVRGGDDRARHEAYGSLWRLVRSSKKLQLSVFDTLQRQRLLEAIINDISHTFRGLRQSAAKLLLSLVHRSSYVQTMMRQSPTLARFVVPTDVPCAKDESAGQNNDGMVKEHQDAKRSGGQCICLLACGREFMRQESRLKALQRQVVPVSDDDDVTALGSAIITAMLSATRFLPGERRDYDQENDDEALLPKASACDAVTLPSMDWQNGPVDPDRFLLGFAANGSQISSRSVAGESRTVVMSDTVHATLAQPAVVVRHMHRWKEHVSRSLLTQLSILHDIYRTSIIVERRQHTKDHEFESIVISGSVSMAIFGLVFRHACIESAHALLGQDPAGGIHRRADLSDPMTRFLESGDAAVSQNSAATSVTTYNSSLAHIHHIISSEVGVRKMPHGLRGVMLFEDYLVSRHDTVFTECPGRILSWNVFRRYWVHRWAADRLRSQIGLETCKSLLNGFDAAVRRGRRRQHAHQAGENDKAGEVKVKCSEFHRILEADSSLANHRSRDLILRAVSLGVESSGYAENEEKNDGDDAISWGMYMHTLVFHIHESHTKEKRSRARKARDAAMNAPKPFHYADPTDTLTTIQQSKNTSLRGMPATLAAPEGKDRNARDEDLDSSSSSSFEGSGTDSDDDKNKNVARLMPYSKPSGIRQRRQFEDAGEEKAPGKRQKGTQQPQPLQHRPGSATPKMSTTFQVSPTLMGERVQSKRHALIQRLAHKQRRLRNMELELQRADDKAVEKINRQRLLSPSRRRKLEERDAHENAKRERLRAKVQHLRQHIARLNEKVGTITGGEHKLVTAATGISLVQEASRISRLDDAKSKHKREVHARVARNKRILEEQHERKRKAVEAKTTTQMSRQVSGMRSRQRVGALSTKHAVPRRPSSAGARMRRSRAGAKHRGAGVARGRSVTRLRHRSKGKRVGTSSPSLNRRTRRAEGTNAGDVSSAGGSYTPGSDSGAVSPGAKTTGAIADADAVDETADALDDVDARMHDFGMPGYGTARAWQELKLFFAERVRINKAKAAKAQSRRVNHIRRRESNHIKRVQRRKSARSRSAHARLVARHRATEKVLAERARRAEVEVLRVSDAHGQQHAEDVAWIQSSHFSPRARGDAYDSMRRLAHAATPTVEYGEYSGGSRYSRGKDMDSNSRRNNAGGTPARPQSASPRLRNKENATALMAITHAKVVDGGVSIPLEISRILSPKIEPRIEQQRPSTAHGMYRRKVSSGMEAAASSRQHWYGASSGSLSARDASRGGPPRIVLPTRPSTARPNGNAATRPSMHDNSLRGTNKHSQLVAELADAKNLLEEIKSEQQALRGRVSRTLSDSERRGGRNSNNDGDAGNSQSSDALGSLPSSNGRPGKNGKAKSSKAGCYEQSFVKAAIVEAVQMQMLRQWPSKHMSLRVRRLVHTQLRSRAEKRAENVELDHATQRLDGKKNSSAPAKSSLQLQRPEDAGRRARSGSVGSGGKSASGGGKTGEPEKPPAPRVRPKDAPSAFERMRSVSGASPLIKFRRKRSQNL